MATDEMYLDNLLKSLTENEQQPRTMEDAMREVAQTTKGEEDLMGMSDDLGQDDSGIGDDDLASLFAEALAGENEQSEKDVQKKEDTLTDIFEETQPDDNGADASFDDTEDWQSSLDELLAQADEQVKADSDSADKGNADGMNLFGSEEGMDADLAEINGLLNSADNNENVEDDMLALLESVKDDQTGSNDINDGYAFDIFAEDAAHEAIDDSTDSAEHEDYLTEEKSPKRKLFSGKKTGKEEKKSKRKKKKSSKQGESEEALNTELSLDEVMDAGDNGENHDIAKTKEKPGFFAKVLDYLTREEDEPSDADEESAENLKESDKEEKKKARKEEKEKKKAEKKKKKGKADAAPEGEEEGDAEADAGKKKKKKEKKKKEKPPKDEEKEKPVKVLSRRNLLVLVAVCATLTASICLLSTFLPEYADKQNARQAFYDGNYEEAYGLLYGKNLNSSDDIIYNRVRIVLTIERKLKSYENNLAMNRELEALDALLQGISCYQKLDGIDEYGVRGEVDTIYQQICSILENNYDITLEEAMEINAYDNATYTRKLSSVINGTEFVIPGEEPVEELPPQDILPEEEEIISY